MGSWLLWVMDERSSFYSGFQEKNVTRTELFAKSKLASVPKVIIELYESISLSPLPQ